MSKRFVRSRYRMSDPWIDEWSSMTYTERLNWWWAARRSYQSQEDFAAGKLAAEGVSCKYGIPGFLPGTRTSYVKPVTSSEEVKSTEESKPVEEVKATEETKPTEETTSVEETKPTEETNSVEETKSTASDENKSNPGIVNLIIPPGNSTFNVNSGKKKKNKNKVKNH